ncbi:MAG: DUF1647 domain-containing protein [Cyclobacteriaceae bacterium]
MNKKKPIILTAANARYYDSFRQLVYTIVKHKEHQNSRLIFYDLGLDAGQIQDFDHRYSAFEWIEFRTFDFDNYPNIVNLTTYAWKPIIIQKNLVESKGKILWLDCANMILQRLDKIWEFIDATGAYTPFSGGTLRQWTHPTCLSHLDVPKEWHNSRNRMGGLCGFDYQHAEFKNLVEKWAELSQIKDCILPDGANRKNHRHDQSILTILLLALEKQANVTLTNEKVNINTSQPNPYISVHNKIGPKFLMPVGPLSYWYFKIWRFFDVSNYRLRGQV